MLASVRVAVVGGAGVGRKMRHAVHQPEALRVAGQDDALGVAVAEGDGQRGRLVVVEHPQHGVALLRVVNGAQGATRWRARVLDVERAQRPRRRGRGRRQEDVAQARLHRGHRAVVQPRQFVQHKPEICPGGFNFQQTSFIQIRIIIWIKGFSFELILAILISLLLNYYIVCCFDCGKFYYLSNSVI